MRRFVVFYTGIMALMSDKIEGLDYMESWVNISKNAKKKVYIVLTEKVLRMLTEKV